MSTRDFIEKDYYAALGVPKDADAAAIKKAYRQLARELHPDKNPGNDAAESRFKEVSEAYDVLSDPKRRGEYDEARRLFGAGGRPGRLPRRLPRCRRRAALRPRRPVRRGRRRRRRRRRGGLGDLFGGLFGAGRAGDGARPQPGGVRPRPRSGRRDRGDALLRGGGPRRDRAAADAEPRHVPDLLGQRREAGDAPAHLHGVPGRRGHQPEPGRVRVLRAVPQLPRHRLRSSTTPARPAPAAGSRRRPARSRSASRPASRTASASGWPARAPRDGAAVRRVTCSSSSTSPSTACSAARATT